MKAILTVFIILFFCTSVLCSEITKTTNSRELSLRRKSKKHESDNGFPPVDDEFDSADIDENNDDDDDDTDDYAGTHDYDDDDKNFDDDQMNDLRNDDDKASAEGDDFPLPDAPNDNDESFNENDEQDFQDESNPNPALPFDDDKYNGNMNDDFVEFDDDYYDHDIDDYSGATDGYNGDVDGPQDDDTTLDRGDDDDDDRPTSHNGVGNTDDEGRISGGKGNKWQGDDSPSQDDEEEKDMEIDRVDTRSHRQRPGDNNSPPAAPPLFSLLAYVGVAVMSTTLTLCFAWCVCGGTVFRAKPITRDSYSFSAVSTNEEGDNSDAESDIQMKRIIVPQKIAKVKSKGSRNVSRRSDDDGFADDAVELGLGLAEDE